MVRIICDTEFASGVTLVSHLYKPFGMWVLTNIPLIFIIYICYKFGFQILTFLFFKNYKIQLDAGKMDYVDNISVNWLPQNIDTEAEGSHNGQNYLAYT